MAKLEDQVKHLLAGDTMLPDTLVEFLLDDGLDVDLADESTAVGAAVAEVTAARAAAAKARAEMVQLAHEQPTDDPDDPDATKAQRQAWRAARDEARATATRKAGDVEAAKLKVRRASEVKERARRVKAAALLAPVLDGLVTRGDVQRREDGAVWTANRPVAP